MNWPFPKGGPNALCWPLLGWAIAASAHSQTLQPPAAPWHLQATGTNVGAATLYEWRPSSPRTPRHAVTWSSACADCAPAQTLLARAASEVGVDAHLAHAVAWTESAFRADAVSPKGAMGLMQLMPATARQYGVADPFDPWQNVQGGTRLLRDLLTRYAGDTRLALAAYNAGPQAVERAGRTVPNYPETQAYVHTVLNRHAWLVAQAGSPADAPTAPGATSAPAMSVLTARGAARSAQAPVVFFPSDAQPMREPTLSQRRIGNALVLTPHRPTGNLLAQLDP